MQKITSFTPEEQVEIQVVLDEILPTIIIRKTTHKSTEFVSQVFKVKKLDGVT